MLIICLHLVLIRLQPSFGTIHSTASQNKQIVLHKENEQQSEPTRKIHTKTFHWKHEGNISSNSSNLFTYIKDDIQQQSKSSNPALPICLTSVPISVLTLSADDINKPTI